MGASVIAFAQNAALLLAVAVVYDVGLNARRPGLPPRGAQLLMGAVLAVIGIAIMLTPFQFAPGLFFDTRTVLLTLAGLFFGPMVSLVPMVAMVAFRITQGGGGTPTGVLVIALAWLVGVGWQRWRGQKLVDLTLRELAGFGFVANLVVLVVIGLGLSVTLPAPVAQQATAQLVPPSILVMPVATALVGGLLVNRLRSRHLTEANELLQAEVEAQLAAVRASRARIVAAGDEERKRVERDIHDGAQQRLVGLTITLRLLQSKLGPDASGDAVATLEQARTDAKAALTELRELARGIHPQILTDSGIGPAIEQLANNAPIPVRLTIETDGRYKPSVESAAYFVVSEALANMAKYAEASEATIRLAELAGSLRVEVCDDGIGGADPARGSGLRGLMDRLAAINATMDVISPKGGGTRLVATIPLPVATAKNRG
jgi:signal transduction histidine kinase